MRILYIYLMNKRIKKLYTCCLDNRVIVCDTNLFAFYESLKKVQPKLNSYGWYYDKFKLNPEFVQAIDDKEYCFQQIV